MQNDIKRVYFMPLGGILLSLVGGFMEGYTYMLRGGVFCNAQTGNIAIMMISFAKGSFFVALPHFLSLLAFVLGVFVSNFSFFKRDDGFNIISQDSLLVFEIVVLTYICFVPLGVDNIWVSTMMSFVSAMQYNAFRQVDGVAYSSVFCTNNIKQATLGFFDYIVKDDCGAFSNSKKYLLVVFFFAVGVLFAAILASLFGKYSLFAAVLLLVLLFVIDKINFTN